MKNKLLSSAYAITVASFVKVKTSLIYSINNRNPSMLNCGTRESIFSVVEVAELWETNC